MNAPDPLKLDSSTTVPATAKLLYRPLAGMRYPGVIANPAKKELEGLARLLEKKGIKVRRPAPVNCNYNTKTPFWKSKGFCTASPRDGILIVGDEMIETPMAWRSRYFEVYAYRDLLNEYFDAGATLNIRRRGSLQSYF